MEFGWSYQDYMNLTVPQLKRFSKSLIENKKEQNKLSERQQEEAMSKYMTNSKSKNV